MRLPISIFLLSKQIFEAFLCVYIIFYILDIMLPGFITNIIKFDQLLAIIILSGTVTVATEDLSSLKIPKMPDTYLSNILLVFILSTLSFLCLIIKLSEFPNLRFAISVLSAFIVLAVGIVLLVEGDKNSL